jgi:hypothetical protein
VSRPFALDDREVHRRLGAPVLLELLDVRAIDTGSSVRHDEARWATRLARRDVNTMQTLLVGSAQHRGDSARMPFRRNLFAVLFAASLLSACSANGSTGEEQAPTGQPTSVTSVTPQVTPSPSPGASSPSLNTTSPRISSPSPSTGTRGPGTSTSPTARRLCDTKVESANPVLRGVRFGRHDTFDRLAFDFCKPADTTLRQTVVKQVTEDASGNKVTLQGRYFYAITLTPADAHDSAGRATVSNRAVTVAGNYMQQYKLVGDFEGVVTYGLGVRRLAETAGGIQSDPNDPRHIVLYFDLGPQSEPDGQE